MRKSRRVLFQMPGAHFDATCGTCTNTIYAFSAMVVDGRGRRHHGICKGVVLDIEFRALPKFPGRDRSNPNELLKPRKSRVTSGKGGE